VHDNDSVCVGCSCAPKVRGSPAYQTGPLGALAISEERAFATSPTFCYPPLHSFTLLYPPLPFAVLCAPCPCVAASVDRSRVLFHVWQTVWNQPPTFAHRRHPPSSHPSLLLHRRVITQLCYPSLDPVHRENLRSRFVALTSSNVGKLKVLESLLQNATSYQKQPKHAKEDDGERLVSFLV